jgi:hypothetical protein
MFQPCAPANVRNALTPVPVAQVVTPVLAVPAVAAIMRDQLDGWCGAGLGRARLERKGGSLGRDGSQNYCSHKSQDRGPHFFLKKRTLR